MIQQSPAEPWPAAPKQAAVANAAKFVSRGECGALVLDRLGQILHCSESGERMLAAEQARLDGRWITEFIPDLLLGGSSANYSARYLVYLCAESEWRPFEATDVDGRRLTVEINLSRMATDGQEVFVLKMRRPGEMTCP